MFIIVAVALSAWLPTAHAVPCYNIDGQINDWNVQLELYNWSGWWTSGKAFVQDSFIPDPLGTIDYKVEDWWPSDSMPAGGEAYDYEAIYFDDSPTYLYIGVISSQSWDYPDNNVCFVVDGVPYWYPEFDDFAWQDLGMDEIIGGQHYPNYFWEGKISTAKVGWPMYDAEVSVYANCGCTNDVIWNCTSIDNPIPEPATILLMGIGLIGLAGSRYVRRRSA